MNTCRIIVFAMAGCFLLGTANLLLRAEPVSDKRVALELTPQQNESVREEMRQLLASVSGIVTALDQNDLKAALQAARKSGISMAAQVENSLKEKLPPGFKKLGKSVHVGFDEIADAAGSGPGEKDKVISLLGKQLKRCVACHATYRLK